MFNVKWGIVSAIAGFILAFLASLFFGHTGLPIALFRAAVFGILFFGLGGGIWGLINMFIPEILIPGASGNAASDVFSTEGMEASGSHVNITLDDSNAALPDTDTSSSAAVEVGDFNDLVSGTIQAAKDIDQTPDASYTDDEEVEGFTPVFEDVKTDDQGEGDFSMDFGAFIPDSGGGEDSFMDSFSLFPGDGDSGKTEEIAPPERKPLGNKTAKLEGDFDAREIAAGLRTVLQKDKG